MKRLIIMFVLSLSLLPLVSCKGKSKVYGTYGFASIGTDPDRYDGDEVYVCTGGSSKRYHRNKHCKGLRSCGGTVERVYQTYAEEKGRTPCKMCNK